MEPGPLVHTRGSGKFWLTAYLLLSGFLFWKAAPETDKPVLTPTATASTTNQESAQPQFVTKPIGQIQLVDRVTGT